MRIKINILGLLLSLLFSVNSFAATYYSQADGNWSTLANWDTNAGGGGTDPASVADMDDDTFIIQAGHEILMDADMSGFANGIAGLTITSHATDPGMLYFKTGTDGWLQMKTGTNIVGTNAAAKGRILANNEGTWRGIKGTTVTGSASGDTLTAVSHGLTDTTAISFFRASPSDILPAPLEESKVYYVRDKDDNTFKVALTSGGAAINLTTDGTGTFGVNTVLAFANKAVINFLGTAAGKVDCQYLDVALVGYEPTVKYLTTYRDRQSISSRSSNVLTLGGAHGWSANRMVKLKTSGGTLPGGLYEGVVYYVISPSGADLSLSLSSGGSAITLTSDHTGTVYVYSGSEAGYADYPYDNDINTFEDVSAVTGWVTTAEHDVVVYADVGPADYDIQGPCTIDAIGAGTIGTSVDWDSAQYPGSLIVLSSRNVSVRSASTGSSQPVFDYASATGAAGAFQCEIRKTGWSGTTFYGSGVYSGMNHTISGTVTGNSYGVYPGMNHTISGTVIGNGSGVREGMNHTISGTVTGNSYGVREGTNHTISGTVIGNGSGVYSGTNHTISGTVTGNSNGVYPGMNHTISGTVTGNSNGVYSGTNHTISGTVTGNSYDFRFSGFNKHICRNANMGTGPTFYARNLTDGTQARVRCEGYLRVAADSYTFDNFGDIKKTAVNSGGDAPTENPDGVATGDVIEALNIQSNCGALAIFDSLVIIEEQRIWLTAAEHTVQYDVQTTYDSIAAGNLKLTCTYIGTNGVLTEITDADEITGRGADPTDWTQNLEVTFTPSAEGWATFKIELMEYEENDEVYIWPEPTIN